MTFYFGSHIKGDLIDSVDDIYKSGGNFVQIFIKNYNKDELLKFKDYLNENSMKCVIHSSYTINIAKNWDKYSWWMKELEIELETAYELGALGIVIHFGKQLELSKEEAYNNMFSAIIYLINKTKKYEDIKILLETTAGQGTEMCHNIDDLVYFFNKFKLCNNKHIKKRIKICLDTCHIFAAGYDIKTKYKIKHYLQMFEELIGIKYIQLIHLNDSKCDLGCRTDRHANIGNGYIGSEALSIIFNYFKKYNIPVILETPDKGYKTEIKLLSDI